MPNSEVNTNNETKYWSYTVAFDRMKLAQEEKFYLEAVTIAESIICDRLLSFLVEKGAFENEKEETIIKKSFGRLIKLWKSRAVDDTDLVNAVDLWREKRNEIVHGIVKSLPSTEHPDIEDFLAYARETAKEGEELAGKVRSWKNKNSDK